MKYAYIPLIALLGACGGPVIIKDKPTRVSVPVTVPCVSGERPAQPQPLKDRRPDWYSLTPKQKAEIAAAQALRHQSYGQALNAATGACQ